MPHSPRARRTFIAYTFCFLSFAAFGFYSLQFNATTQTADMTQTVDLASTSTDFETPQQCGEDRNYFEKDLRSVPALWVQTRNEIGKDQPKRSCVTYIMKNFLPLDKAMKTRGMCKDQNGNQLSSPTKGDSGFKAPCVTEEYVNSVYNSLLDVSDCMNVSFKELLPKLFNESGLHVNTLGPSYDTGVGQLTQSALGDDVFEPYNDQYKAEIDPATKKTKPRVNQVTTYEYYLQEMAKSSKPSCKRILAEKNVIELVPKESGKILCDSKFAATENGSSCLKVWSFDNRCMFMNFPENPLRNVLTMAMLYRNNLKNATGVTYVAGQDMLAGQLYSKETPLRGYFSAGRYIERLKALGVQHPNQDVLKQAILSLGFNAGPILSRSIINEYIGGREKLKLKTSDADFNFQDTDIKPWDIVTSQNFFWKGLSLTKDEFKASYDSLAVLANVKLKVETAQKSYKDLRNVVQKDLADLKKKNLGEEENNKALAVLKTKHDELRKKLLADVYQRAASLTLPEFARIAHAYKIVFDPKKQTGGAPGYLTYIAAKYKTLKDSVPDGACVVDTYLKF